MSTRFADMDKAGVIAEYEKLQKKFDDAADSAEGLAGAIGKLQSIGAQGRGVVADQIDTYGQYQKVLKETTGVLDGLLGGFSKVLGKLPVLGPAMETAVDGAKVLVKGLGAAADAIGKVPKEYTKTMDSFTSGLRSFEKEMFDVHKGFGGTIDEAKKFADTMRLASDNPLARSLHMTTNEMNQLRRATDGTATTQKQLATVVETGAGSIELFGAATAFAASAGIDLNKGAQILNTLLNKQGKSAQEATNMMGMYVAVTEESGLAIEQVAESLNRAVSNFAKLGMAADFGAPIMKGFTSTMQDMGLGIENAVGLSETLTGSLAGLTDNYAMAYLTFQRGGLDIGGGGGGGVLGSSIGLQAALLDAEKTGDQAAIGDQLVRGMRDTLASFTGGDIVTVQQAAEDPSMQNQFYVQQQMLKQNYGLGGQDATRVLDMLSRLDEATRMGDKEAQEALKEQIAKETDGRDKTLDEMTKVNRQLQIQTNLQSVHLRTYLDETRRAAAGGGRGMMKLASGADSVARSSIISGANMLSKIQNLAGVEDPAEQNRQLLAALAPSPGQNAPMNRIDQASANLAVRGATRQPGGATDRSLKDIMENYLGRDIDRAGSAVMGNEIGSLARIIASQAAPGDLPSDGRAGLQTQIAQDLKQALENLNIKVDMTPRTAGVFQATAETAEGLRTIGTGIPGP